MASPDERCVTHEEEVVLLAALERYPLPADVTPQFCARCNELAALTPVEFVRARARIIAGQRALRN